MYFKRFIYLTLLTILFTACTSKQNMKLTGSITGLKKGTLILQKIEDSILVSLDSIRIDGNLSFEFNREIKSPEIYFLYLRLKDGTLLDERIPFFAEPGELNIQSSLKKFANDVVISGSKTNLKNDEHKKIIQRFIDQNIEYLAAEFEARKDGNDSLANEMEKKRYLVLKRKYLASINFAINNNDSEIAPFIATTSIVDANKKYLDTIYNALTPRVKNSYYGQKLEKLLAKQ